MLIYAIVFISLALVCYTVGVWSEKVQNVLKPWHTAVFWTGFCFDTIGTTLMTRLASSGFKLNFHGITGLTAIALMAFHAVWATVVTVTKNDVLKKNFHKFSIVVWFIWLVPYISGAVFGMAR